MLSQNYYAPYMGRMALVSRQKLSGWGTHEGVLVPSGHVVHLTQDGIRQDTLEDFAQGRAVSLRHEVPYWQHAAALTRMNWLMLQNKGYDLISNNCEVFARTVTLNQPKSPQVAFWTAAAVVAAIYASSAT